VDTHGAKSDDASQSCRIRIRKTKSGIWHVRARHGAAVVEFETPAPAFTNLPLPELSLETIREYGGRLHAAIFSEELERLLE
jgi:hypothetical protein